MLCSHTKRHLKIWPQSSNFSTVKVSIKHYTLSCSHYCLDTWFSQKWQFSETNNIFFLKKEKYIWRKKTPGSNKPFNIKLMLLWALFKYLIISANRLSNIFRIINATTMIANIFSNSEILINKEKLKRKKNSCKIYKLFTFFVVLIFKT